MKDEKFSVIREFPNVLASTQVSLGRGGVLSLGEGMERAVRMLEEVRCDGRKALLIGNGGSAAIASHQAVDLWRNAGVRAMAFNDPAQLTCIANDFGYTDVFARPIEMFADIGDLVIAISSSGRSLNILGAVEKARDRGCPVIGFSGFHPGNPLRGYGDLNFYVPSHSYGVVEAAHLLLIHGIVDEFAERSKITFHESRSAENSLFENPPHS